MAPIVSQHLPVIEQLCKEHAVERLYVFGSAARGDDFTSESDVDFLASFKKQLSACKEEELLQYFDNKDELADALKKLFGRDVDLLTEDNIRNKYLNYFIHSEKILVYASA